MDVNTIVFEVIRIIEDKDRWNNLREVEKAIELLNKIPKEYRTKTYYMLKYALIEQHRLLTNLKTP